MEKAETRIEHSIEIHFINKIKLNNILTSKSEYMDFIRHGKTYRCSVADLVKVINGRSNDTFVKAYLVQ